MRSRYRLHSIMRTVNPNVVGPHIAGVCHQAAEKFYEDNQVLAGVLHFLEHPEDCKGGLEGATQFAIEHIKRIVET